MQRVLISSASKEELIKALNNRFYSTSYSITEDGQVTWLKGEIAKDLYYRVKRGRHQITSSVYM